MPRVCSVCRHNKRSEIDEALLSGSPLRTIADRYKLAKTSLIRHKASHIPERLEKAKQANEAKQAGSLSDLIASLEQRAGKYEQAAAKKKDYRTALAGVREGARLAELRFKTSPAGEDATETPRLVVVKRAKREEEKAEKGPHGDGAGNGKTAVN